MNLENLCNNSDLKNYFDPEGEHEDRDLRFPLKLSRFLLENKMLKGHS